MVTQHVEGLEDEREREREERGRERERVEVLVDESDLQQ